MNRKPAKRQPRLFNRVAAILEEARTEVVRTVNTRMVIAYWLIGREIVQEEQGGQRRAGYGDTLLEDLSKQLMERYGNGYSVTNLKNIRTFYQTYANRLPEIGHAVSDQLTSAAPMPGNTGIRHAVRDELALDLQVFSHNLSWTHYRLLMRVENQYARAFYEQEAINGRWSSRDLERQINSLLFERMLKSRNKKGVMALAKKGNQPKQMADILKDPFVLEFLNLPEGHELVESQMEQSLVEHMRQFLLELGCGFAFVARQQRLTLDGDHFYVDLTFYHTRLKCFVLIDLKVGKLTQQDLGQMQLYVNYYDRELRAPDDNPTVGLILCTDRNDAMVRYTLPQNQKQVFAARYRTALPSEDDLLRLLRRDWDMVVREQRATYGTTGAYPSENP
jgi:predicted nuclease of restriction endonuclease-like (RecB) superfamily